MNVNCPAPPLARPADLRCREEQIDGEPSWLLVASRATTIGSVLFTVFWCGFLVVWYCLVLAQPSPSLGALLFPLLHVVVGLALIRWSLCNLLNRARVRIGREQVQVLERPLPSFDDVSEATAGVERFEARQQASSENDGSPTPVVVLLTRDGRARRLQIPLASDDHARWLAQQWNAALATAQAPPIPKTYRG
jgi:hypothetical protein